MIKRYSRKEIANIWEEKNKYQIWLNIEIAAAQAMEKLKLIPKGVASTVRKKAKIIRALPLPPISLRKGPVPIFPPNKEVNSFFSHLGIAVEISNEKLFTNFWCMTAMMAPYYEILNTLSKWLSSKGLKKIDTQKYITSLFFAMSKDAVLNSKKDLKILVKDSQTTGGLNEQALNKLRKLGFYKLLNKTANSVLKRLKKV